MNFKESIYDPNFPLDTIVVKEVPSAIRKKATMLINVIELIENNRVTNNLNKTEIDTPELKSVFLLGDENIPSGLYLKIKDSWIGFNEFKEIPELSEVGERYTYNNQSYQLYENNNTKILALKNKFNPMIFYDFFEATTENQELENRGLLGTSPLLKLSKIFIENESTIPYINTTKNSQIRTYEPITFGNSFTFSATFKNITREYVDTNEIADINYLTILMFFADVFDNIKCGLAYDQYNELYWIDKENKTRINYQINPNSIYQISIKMFNDKITVMIDNNEVFTTTKLLMKDKQYIFSVGEDMDYGHYLNASICVGEIQIFQEALTIEENMWLKNYPRTWNLNKKESYLDLTLEEKLKLKEFIKTIK